MSEDRKRPPNRTADDDAEPRHVLLAGRPGVGKTTVVRRLADRLSGGARSAAPEEDGTGPAGDGRRRDGLDAAPPPLRIAGFFTEEIRDEGKRQGFRAVTLEGDRERTIAHRSIEGEPRVAAYGVDVEAVDELAAAALDPALDPDAWLIDEIGKMECLSDRFVEAIRALLDGGTPVVATVGVGGPDFMEAVRRRRDAGLWRVTRENRDALPARLDRAVRKRVGAADG